jgi:simple sugar transport system ATP-binding protein
VLEVADRIEVMRLGERVASFTRSQATLESLVGAMTGAYVQETPPSDGPVTER